MMNETTITSFNTQHTAIFGTRLKAAREALGMGCKDIAAQLRLQEKIIVMLESGEYGSDIPVTFIRGYIRSYSKLLGIPENEVHEAMELFTPKPVVQEAEIPAPAPAQIKLSSPASIIESYLPFHSGNFIMKLFTCLLLITVIGLVGIWWFTHTTKPVATPVAKQTVVTEANTETPALDVNVDLETLAPSFTLKSLLLTAYTPYALQAMIMELEYFMIEATAAKFALTDKSTPIGQFFPRKTHKHHATDSASVKVPPENLAEQDEDGNIIPPYYHQQ